MPFPNFQEKNHNPLFNSSISQNGLFILAKTIHANSYSKRKKGDPGARIGLYQYTNAHSRLLTIQFSTTYDAQRQYRRCPTTPIVRTFTA